MMKLCDRNHFSISFRSGDGRGDVPNSKLVRDNMNKSHARVLTVARWRGETVNTKALHSLI